MPAISAASSGSSARSSPRQSRISPGPDTTEPTVSACRSKLPAEPFPFLDCFLFLAFVDSPCAAQGEHREITPKPGLFWCLILTACHPGRNPYHLDGGWAAEAMTQSYETGKAMVELGAKQPHELLLLLGGVLAILLSVAIYGIQAANQGIQPSQYGAVATTVVINVVLGGALWASAAIMRKNLMYEVIVTGMFNILLIYIRDQHVTLGI